MDIEIINKIVWWIPIKSLRDSVRNFLKKKCKVPDFYAAESQDYHAYRYLKSINKDPRNFSGFYIDIGAHDGISGSTSYIFEKYGWSGICVEANPNTFKQLVLNRQATCINAAVSSDNIDSAEFFDIKSSSFLGFLNFGISKEELDKNFDKIKRLLNLQQDSNLEYDIINIKVINFEKLMSDFPQITHIDFLSIDVEGGELNILKSINFDKYSFSFITIETDMNGDRIIDFMLSKGYKIFHTTDSDTMFIK